MKLQYESIRVDNFSPETITMVGVSHNNTPVSVRGILSLNESVRKILYDFAKRKHAGYLLIISTCNRVEIYCDHRLVDPLITKWQEISGSKVVLQEFLEIKRGAIALGHLYAVISGVESQIPGDMQISHQVKLAFGESKCHRMTTGLFEQAFNFGLQCGKKVRTETDISTGVSSVPSAVSLLVRENEKAKEPGEILIIGAGKMGHLSCQNLLKTIDASRVILINRNDSKANQVASRLGVKSGTFSNLPDYLKRSDIVIVATGSPNPIITTDLLAEKKTGIFFDLSVPSNISQEVKKLDGV
ncbi:MAG: hypothetical protein DWQ02_19440, partial [Bacteroidetes bacterium]